jgi:hypothetical protein
MSLKESKDGEFTLLYNLEGKPRPVVLTKDQHDMLQALVNNLPGNVKVLESVQAVYEEA